MLSRLHFKPLTQQHVRTYIGDGMQTLIARATGTKDPALLTQAVTIFRDHYTEHCCEHARLYPGVAEILQHFSGRRKAIVTNKPHAMTHRILQHLKLNDCVEYVCSAESTVNRKPHPDPILKALSELGAAPDHAIVIGDGTTDIQAGKSAGTRTCAVTYGYRSRKELEDCGPDFIIDRPDELKNLI